MQESELNRRDFTRLTMAAFGGTLAATVAGCAKPPAPAPAKAPPAGGPAAGMSGAPSAEPGGDGGDGASLVASVAAVAVEKHVCRGLNACKNQGAGEDNDCAGQGACATLEHHSCGKLNDCKGQGGCGEVGVENDCKGQGGCHMPLMPGVWKKARRIFEAKMKAEEKEFGEAPPAKKS